MISCLYESITYFHGEKYYCCVIDKIQPPDKKRLEIAGQHEQGKNNNDVDQILFENGIIFKIPRELTIIFPNLKNLAICKSKLMKISKRDLFEYQSLEVISMRDNELEYLPGDLFDNFKVLNYINFERNKLNLIEPNILNNLKAIKYVSFSENPRYQKWHSIYPVHKPNATLEEVKNELYEKFYLKFDFLQDLKNSSENLKLENNELKKHIERKTTFNFTSNVTDDFKKYIQDENSKDFKIVIDDRELLVHKLLLIIRSPTLAEVLRNNPEVETLNLVDIPIQIFEKILNFLYTDELPGFYGTNFLQLFAAAGRLKIKRLTNFAAEKLLNQVNSENALEILKLSNKFKYKELRQKAIEEFKRKYPNVRDEWLENQEKLNNIVEMFKDKEDAIRKFEQKFKEMLEM
ncbi:hypothetical protein ACKWTF_012737 [Chironomus riparius]